MFKKVVLVLILIFSCAVTDAKELTPQEVMRGICRITAKLNEGYSKGSGTIIKKDKEYYYILTNGHVTTKTGSVVGVELFKDGIVSGVVEGTVKWRYFVPGSSIDLALITVPVKTFGEYKPTVIDLAPIDSNTEIGDLIYGAGFPSGRWAQYWESRIGNITSNVYYFTMPPENGQSGSAILKTITDSKGEKHTKVVGVIAWRMSNPSQIEFGAGLNLKRMYEVLSAKAKVDQVNMETTANTNCNRCGRPKEEHILNQVDGKLHCPTCKEHGLTHNEHLEKGMNTEMFCGPGGCFPRILPPIPSPPPFGRREPREEIPEANPSPLPLENKPGTIFPPSTEEDNGRLLELEQENHNLTLENEKLTKDAEHPLDSWTNKNGETVENTSLILGGGLVGSMLMQQVLMPWLIRRAGNRLPRKLVQALGSRGIARLAQRLSKKKVVENKLTLKPNNSEVVPAPIDLPPLTKSESAEQLSTNVSINNNINVDLSDKYARQLFEQKEKDGEANVVYNWTLMYDLYTEAVDRLRNGLFAYKQGVDLQGQKLTAEAIDKWVRSEFVRRIQYEELKIEPKPNKGMLALLYRDAVVKLKEGHFPVLGAAETAAAIQDWVHKEFLKRVNIRI